MVTRTYLMVIRFCNIKISDHYTVHQAHQKWEFFFFKFQAARMKARIWLQLFNLRGKKHVSVVENITLAVFSSSQKEIRGKENCSLRNEARNEKKIPDSMMMFLGHWN